VSRTLEVPGFQMVEAPPAEARRWGGAGV